MFHRNKQCFNFSVSTFFLLNEGVLLCLNKQNKRMFYWTFVTVQSHLNPVLTPFSAQTLYIVSLLKKMIHFLSETPGSSWFPLKEVKNCQS